MKRALQEYIIGTTLPTGPCIPVITMAILSDSEAHKHDCEHLDWSQKLTHFHWLVKPNPFARYSSTQRHVVSWDQLEQGITMATMDITSSFTHLLTWK